MSCVNTGAALGCVFYYLWKQNETRGEFTELLFCVNVMSASQHHFKLYNSGLKVQSVNRQCRVKLLSWWSFREPFNGNKESSIFFYTSKTRTMLEHHVHIVLDHQSVNSTQQLRQITKTAPWSNARKQTKNLCVNIFIKSSASPLFIVLILL